MTITDPTTTDIDEQAIEEFAGRLFDLFTGAALSPLIDIGRRTRLFDAAGHGPVTSAELAARAGLQERYVREWLGAMASAGIFEFEPSTATYWLPREHAACLTGDGPENMSGLAFLTTILGRHVPAVTDAFRDGGGVPYDAYAPEIHEALDALWGPVYEQLLVPAYLPLVPRLTERLTAGARVADVACGAGKALLALATAFPASTFIGYDLDTTALEMARAAALKSGLGNVTFERADAAELAVDEPVDIAFVFNAIHDQAKPTVVLKQIYEALAPGGLFIMDEPRVSSLLEENLGNPMAAFLYAVSTLHCLTVSLAEDGAGLGTAWGEQLAVQMLRDAGFGTVAIHDAPGDPGNAVFVTARPAGS